jgi:hypothetical protein
MELLSNRKIVFQLIFQNLFTLHPLPKELPSLFPLRERKDKYHLQTTKYLFDFLESILENFRSDIASRLKSTNKR